MFQNNQKRFFGQTEGQERHIDIIPDVEVSKQFWSEIWSERVNHNEKAECLKRVERELKNADRQPEMIITPEIYTAS